MYIVPQDRDGLFTLTDKGLFKGEIFIRVQYFQGQLMGWNVIGKRLFKETLLGTYDEQDAQQVLQEIYRMLKLKVYMYSMPEAAMDIEDYMEG
jgi:hypothetical protein